MICGTSTVDPLETNAALTATGTLTATDIDSAATFVAQSNAAGSNGYGHFDIGANGVWTYTANTAHDEFVGGVTYTDSLTVATADGTTRVITVSILGTNDAAMISGTSTVSLSETNAALTATGTLTATDVDSAATFVAQSNAAGSNGYGHFDIGASGVWTYTANTAHDEFVGGVTYTDSLTVATADGTTKVITVSILGTNDAAMISGTSTASSERDQRGARRDRRADRKRRRQRGDLCRAEQRRRQQRLRPLRHRCERRLDLHRQYRPRRVRRRRTYTDSLTVATADGTTKVITVSILGTNDAAVISGTSSGDVTEDVAVNAAHQLQTSGHLTVTDVDTSAPAFAPQGNVAGDHGYGHFNLDASGTWTYAADNAQDRNSAARCRTNLTDSFTAVSSDGSASKLVTVDHPRRAGCADPDRRRCLRRR